MGRLVAVDSGTARNRYDVFHEPLGQKLSWATYVQAGHLYKVKNVEFRPLFGRLVQFDTP